MCYDKAPGSPTSRDAGFTLVELLITVVILVVGIVSVAQLVPISIGSDLRNRNDSTSLIAAQTLLEQMNQQSMTGTVATCVNGNPPAGHYSFCDANGYGIALGTNTLATDPEGCTLNAVGNIDFTAAASTCSGYTQTENGIELRWRVITLNSAAGGAPYRKVFMVAGRQGGAASFSNVVQNLMSVVGK